MKLPPAPWLERKELKAISAALDGQLRYVGGAVRDTLLGLPITDVDMATPLPPDMVMEQLRAADIKVIPTGIDHGTVTAIFDKQPVEITTLRRDVTTDGRRATVAFSNDWREDAARRDFTINAMSVDPATHVIHDYFDGLKDLEKQHVRFIGDAEQRIREDYLRIMRYFRFLARFGSANNGDQTAYNACQKHAGGLMSLSRERIAEELLKLLSTKQPQEAVAQMKKAGIFDNFLPEPGVSTAGVQLLKNLVNRERSHDIAPDPLRRFAAILATEASLIDKAATRLKMSKKIQKALRARAGDIEPDQDNIAALAYEYGAAACVDRILLHSRVGNISPLLKFLNQWEKPDFLLKGSDLIHMGLEAGPIVSQTLERIRAIWIAEGFPEKARLLAIAQENISAH